MRMEFDEDFRNQLYCMTLNACISVLSCAADQAEFALNMRLSICNCTRQFRMCMSRCLRHEQSA